MCENTYAEFCQYNEEEEGTRRETEISGIERTKSC